MSNEIPKTIEESLTTSGVKLYQHQINDSEKALEGDDRPEFAMMAKYCRGLGLDCGCGTNRLSNSVLTTDWYPHSHTDLIWNCLPEPKQGESQYFYILSCSNCPQRRAFPGMKPMGEWFLCMHLGTTEVFCSEDCMLEFHLPACERIS